MQQTKMRFRQQSPIPLPVSPLPLHMAGAAEVWEVGRYRDRKVEPLRFVAGSWWTGGTRLTSIWQGYTEGGLACGNLQRYPVR